MTHPLVIARAAIGRHGALQKEAELAALLSLLMDVGPATVVEVGSDAGGTLWAWQQLGCRVIGVDLPRAGFNSGAALNEHGCEVVYGDSHNQATADRLVEVLAGVPVDVLFIDGDHSFDGVKQDFEMFAPLVRPGGIVAFHDICVHPARRDVEVWRFWVGLDGVKEELVSDPTYWGGIGVLRVPSLVEVSA